MKEIIWSGASPVLMPREDPAGKVVFAIVLFAFLLVCFVGLMTLLAAVLRGLHDRCKAAIGRSPLRTGLVGVAGYAVFGGFAAWLYSMAFIRRLLETEVIWGYLLAAIGVTILPLLFSLLGAAGMFGYIGDRIAALRGIETSGLRRIVLGTLVAVFAALFPAVGWFVVLPVLLVISFGAAATTIFR